MVHAMASDRGRLPRVARIATIATITACAPSFKPPPAPPPQPGPVAKVEKSPARGGPARQVVVGEMCPQGAGGRPAVAPLIMRTVQWDDNPGDVGAAVERGSVPRFIVLGTDGKLAGAFDTLGLIDVAGGAPVASGTYTGASPCTYEVGAKVGQTSTRAEEPKCGQATAGCGIAVGDLERPGEPPDVPPLPTGGACLMGDQLAVDIDGDGRVESFPLSGVLDGIRGPAQEWTAAKTATATCKPTFQLYDIKLAAEAEAGKQVDHKATVTMDLLGVIDLDGDGRMELVLALRFPTVRSIVVYTASESAQRLDMAGEAAALSQK
jgi:hypothetical protein